jgi:hypothetical protein
MLNMNLQLVSDKFMEVLKEKPDTDHPSIHWVETMTTCPFCLDNMAARTSRQLAIRKSDMARVPNATVHPCPYCGGTEWATTDYMVDPDPPSLWKRFVGYWKGILSR